MRVVLLRRRVAAALAGGLAALLALLAAGLVALLGPPRTGGPGVWERVAYRLGLDGLGLGRRASFSGAPAWNGELILIDPGHGGDDPGVKGPEGLEEAEIVLAVARELASILAQQGAPVLLTRDGAAAGPPGEGSGSSPSRTGAGSPRAFTVARELDRRAAAIREARPRLVISLHADWFPSSVRFGPQAYYLPQDPEGRALARAIQAELNRELAPARRGPSAAPLYLLREAGVPGVLVEVGYLSNPQDALRLGQAGYGRQLAEAIAAGVWGFGRTGRREERPGAAAAARWPGPGDLQPGPGEALLFFGSPDDDRALLAGELRMLLPAADSEGESSLPPGAAGGSGASAGAGGGPQRLAAARAALRELLRGPATGSVLLAPLPPGRWMRGLRWEPAGLLTVDLEEWLAEVHPGGTAGEMLTVFSLVNTAAAAAGAGQVLLTLGGRPVPVLTGHLALDRPLERRVDLERIPGRTGAGLQRAGGGPAGTGGGALGIDVSALLVQEARPVPPKEPNQGRSLHHWLPQEPLRRLGARFGFAGGRPEEEAKP